MSTPSALGQPLTPTQLECLTGVARGETSPEIAARTYRARDTVDDAIRHACTRLGARTRAHAVALGITRGLINLEDA
ncbi:helix-turn-helix domain-containing protein [Streptomyces lonarensis]|uniref:Helix-turn-helix transcriptional regulator n=1 Tax=Streptomyces lonarensis TaxID=700599 RepID=A0A7X6CXH5_9ACTN|nr:helix-turn-helix transcriptional regulator [Streptomyces lonarensis]NJQ04255.1 helix-turn-helix transcriptional regulator [Streptomyces lonarensis]